MKTSFKPTVTLIAGRALSFLVTFFIPVVLVRVFHPGEFGTYKQIFLIYAVLFGIAQLGMAESLYYFLPRKSAKDGRIVLNSVITLAFAGSVCLAGLTAFAGRIAASLGNPEVARYVLPLGAFLLLMLITAVLEIAMIARKAYLLASFTYASSDAVRALCLIVPALVWKTLDALMAGVIVFGVLRLLSTVWFLAREFGDELAVDWTQLGRQFAYTLPFELAIIVDIAQANYHQYMVSHHFGAIAFAVYSVGCLQLPFVDLVAGPACNVMMVRMSEELADGDHPRVLAIWHDTTRKLGLAFIPLFVLLVISAREIILLLFTARYAAAIPIFTLWAVMVPLAVFQTDGVLRVYAQTRFILFLNLIRLGIVAALISGFLAAFGLKGAVLVTLLAVAVSRVAALVYGGGLMHSGPARILPWSSLASTTAASIAAALPALFVKTQLHLPPFPSLIAMGCIYSLTYGGIVLGFNLLSDSERLAVSGLIRAEGD
jgi:O-antigen/teichoic acid export membrane protein